MRTDLGVTVEVVGALGRAGIVEVHEREDGTTAFRLTERGALARRILALAEHDRGASLDVLLETSKAVD